MSRQNVSITRSTNTQTKAANGGGPAVRIHQPIEGRQKCKHAEVGIPTTQTDPGGADEDSPDYRADRPYLALSPHRSGASRTEARHHAGRMAGKREHAQDRPGYLQL